MENSHPDKLTKSFRAQLNGQRIVVLGIPDDYEYMDPDLIKILKIRGSTRLPKVWTSENNGNGSK